MPVRQVLQIGAPSLLEPSKLVETFNTPELERLIEDLQDTSTHYDGLGIAAPQIGVNVRVIYFGYEFSKRYPDAPPVPRTVMINPGFEPLSEEMDIAEEGCLSVPNYRAPVPRYTHIRYWGFDISGERLGREASGMHARVVQHEIDHLDGILFPSRSLRC